MARLIPAGGGGLPVGMPMHLPIETMPKNCALLDGSPMPSWASTAVKNMYGATLPDYRGRTPVGTNEGSGRIDAGWADAPGGTGGEDSHTLTVGEMPPHGHSGSTDTAPNHEHSSKGAIGMAATTSTQNEARTRNGSANTSGAGAHGHSVTVNNTGGGESHNNMQPSIAGRWVMKLR